MIIVRTLLFVMTLLPCTACDKEKENTSTPGTPSPAANIVTTFAGTAGVPGYVDGAAATAKFNGPRQMVFDSRPSTNYPNGVLYVADQGFSGLTVRAIDAQTGAVSTYVEKGILESVGDICVAPGGTGSLYITDTDRDILYKVSPNTSGKGTLTLLTGGKNGSGNTVDGNILSAQFDGPTGIVTDKNENLFTINAHYKCVTKIAVQDNKVTTFAGMPSPLSDVGEHADGVGMNAKFRGNMKDLALSADGKSIFIADRNNHALRKIDLATAAVTTYLHSLRGINNEGSFEDADPFHPQFVVSDKNNNPVFTTVGVGAQGGGGIYLADVSKSWVTKIAGGGNKGYKDGDGSDAQFNGIEGIAIHPDGKTLYVSDHYNQCIRKIVIADK